MVTFVSYIQALADFSMEVPRFHMVLKKCHNSSMQVCSVVSRQVMLFQAA
jgi:hypothetical protein